jgi:hypothetical protein
MTELAEGSGRQPVLPTMAESHKCRGFVMGISDKHYTTAAIRFSGIFLSGVLTSEEYFEIVVLGLHFCFNLT